jgi:hypothetical protein
VGFSSLFFRVWWATNNKKEKTLAAGLKVKVTAVPLLVGHLGLAHNTTQHTTPDSSSSASSQLSAAATILCYSITSLLGITSVSE